MSSPQIGNIVKSIIVMLCSFIPKSFEGFEMICNKNSGNKVDKKYESGPANIVESKVKIREKKTESHSP